MHASAPFALLALAASAVAAPSNPPHRGGPPAKPRDLRITGVAPYKYLTPLELLDGTYVLSAAATAKDGATQAYYYPGNSSSTVNGVKYGALQVVIKQNASFSFFADVPLLPVGSTGEGKHDPIYVIASGGGQDAWQLNKKTLLPEIHEANEFLYLCNETLTTTEGKLTVPILELGASTFGAGGPAGCATVNVDVPLAK